MLGCKYLHIASILLLILALAVFGLSCQESAPAPAPTPAPSPTPAPAPTPLPPAPSPAPPEESGESWTADGIISDGEYLSEAYYAGGAYELFWNSDEQYIYIGMRAKTDGWVSVAVQPGRTMKDADMVFGYVEDRDVAVFDLYSTGSFGPHALDTERGGIDDIIEYAGGEVDGVTTIEFKRALATGDELDQELTGGTNQILWAWGADDNLNQKHSNRGYGEIGLPPR